MQILSNPISALSVRGSLKLSHFEGKWVKEHDGDVRFRPEVEIRPFLARAVHPAIIIGTVGSLWNWLWGRYHVPHEVFVVIIIISGFCFLSDLIFVLMHLVVLYYCLVSVQP